MRIVGTVARRSGPACGARGGHEAERVGMAPAVPLDVPAVLNDDPHARSWAAVSTMSLSRGDVGGRA